MKKADKEKLAKRVFSWLRSLGCSIRVEKLLDDTYLTPRLKQKFGAVSYVSCVELKDGKPWNSVFDTTTKHPKSYEVDVIDQFINKKLLTDCFHRIGIHHADSWEEFAVKFSLVEDV